MSFTATVKKDKVPLVSAVCHVDNTARLQTVRQIDNPLYHALIEAFRIKTGVPMVLNTSFNRKKEPIVESPDDALRALQGCQGDITALFIGKNWRIV